MIEFAKWAINNQCNLNCPFCMMHDVKEVQQSFEDKCRVLDKMYLMGVRFLDFFGKEPLLDDTMFRLMQYGEDKRYNIMYTFITNGVNLEKYSEDIIKSPCRSFTVSYDFGADRDFQLDLNVLKGFGSEFNISLSVDVHRDNTKDILKSLRRLNRYNVSLVYLKPIMPYGSLSGNVSPITETEYIFLCQTIQDKIRRPNVMFSIPIEFRYATSLFEIECGRNFEYETDAHCTAGCNSMYVNSEGLVYGCGVVACKGLKAMSKDFLTTPAKEIESFIKTKGYRMCGEM